MSYGGKSVMTNDGLLEQVQKYIQPHFEEIVKQSWNSKGKESSL